MRGCNEGNKPVSMSRCEIFCEYIGRWRNITFRIQNFKCLWKRWCSCFRFVNFGPPNLFCRTSCKCVIGIDLGALAGKTVSIEFLCWGIDCSVRFHLGDAESASMVKKYACGGEDHCYLSLAAAKTLALARQESLRVLDKRWSGMRC